MIFINIVSAGGGQFSGVVKNQIRSTKSTIAAVMVDIANQYPEGTTLYAPKAMAHCMKAGDVKSRGDIDSSAAPAFNSRR